jgi:hypothetical protein
MSAMLSPLVSMRRKAFEPLTSYQAEAVPPPRAFWPPQVIWPRPERSILSPSLALKSVITSCWPVAESPTAL